MSLGPANRQAEALVLMGAHTHPPRPPAPVDPLVAGFRWFPQLLAAGTGAWRTTALLQLLARKPHLTRGLVQPEVRLCSQEAACELVGTRFS